MNLDVEAVDLDLVDGAFFGVEGEVGAFGGAAGVGGPFNPDHSLGRGGIEDSGEGKE